MAGKILIADDEDRMRRVVADFLRKDSFIPLEARDGREAIRVFDERDINLVILDVMMPGFDGWTVCTAIRARSQVPIIMLTARGGETDELMGFGLGADEYITKPFSLRVLMARVQALLRRSDLVLSPEQIEVGGLNIDVTAHRVMADGITLDLSPREFDLLIYLVKNQGMALSREQILRKVWDYNYIGDGRAVDTQIKNLRAKLGSCGHFIQTIRGMGYRFEVPL